MDRAAFQDMTLALGLRLSSEQLDAFEDFEQALYTANRVMNLTRVPRDEAWRRHFGDSLLLSEFLPPGSRVLDIGTGPGLPAWPLARARPDLKLTAIDSNGKMLGFLRGHLLPNLDVVRARAEEWNPTLPFDVVTGRALAPLAVQLEVSARACAKDGLVLPMRTPNDRPFPRHLPQLGLVLEAEHERSLPGTDIVRVFPAYRRTNDVDPKYPRTWAEIRRSPLVG